MTQQIAGEPSKEARFRSELEFCISTLLRDVPEQGSVRRATLKEMFSNIFTLAWQLSEKYALADRNSFAAKARLETAAQVIEVFRKELTGVLDEMKQELEQAAGKSGQASG